MQLSDQIINSNFSVIVTQIQPQVHKIALKGVYTLAALQILQKKVVLFKSNSDNKQVYILFDLQEFNAVSIEVKKWFSKNKVISSSSVTYIVFGLDYSPKTIGRYLFQNVDDSNLYQTKNEHTAVLLANDLLKKQNSNSLPAGPFAITGVVKTNIQLDDKVFDVVHDKRWSYNHPEESYFYEIDLIDNNIFVSRPSGYIEYNNSLTANVLFDKVLFKMLGHEGRYYRIQDYSKVLKSSLSARRDFTQYIANNINRIDLLIFFGLNTYMKAVVNFGKLFHPKFYKVKVVNSFEEALRVIIEHKYGKSYLNGSWKNESDSITDIPLEEEVITLRKELEQLKSAQQNQLDYLFQSIGNIVWDSDSEKISEYSKEGSAYSDIYGALNMLKTDIKELADEREVTIKNLQNQLKDYIVDIRKSKKDLQRVLADKDEFVQALNHELRTPLQSINSTIELLKLSDDKEEDSKLISLIYESSKLLNKKITQIKSVSDLKLGKRELSSSIFNLSKIVQTLIDMHEPVVHAKKMNIHFIHDKNIPPYLMGDIDKINQVIDHFLDNAIKFTNEGEITVRTKLVKDFDTQIQVRIEVEDTGIGINENIQENLFDDDDLMKSSNHDQSSIGLGLFICKQLVELMGGNIGYSSDENKGSCFYFIITLNRGTFFKELNLLNRAKSLKNLAPIYSKHKDILFLEENLESRDVIKLMFEKLGTEVQFANNSAHLLSLTSTGDYGLVFIDPVSPSSACVDVVAKIKSNEENLKSTSTISIIGFTSNPRSIFKEDCINAGFNEIILKPYTINDIKNLLKKYA